MSMEAIKDAPDEAFFRSIAENLIDALETAAADLLQIHNLMEATGKSPFGTIRSVSELALELGIRTERKEEPEHGSIAQELLGDNSDSQDREAIFLGQIKALRQRNNSSCGYYTLFNSIQLMLARHLTDESLARKHFLNMHSIAYFWICFQYWRRVLHEKAEIMMRELEVERQQSLAETGVASKRSGWPWTHADIETGVLERLFMLHLLENDPCVHRLSTECNVRFESLPELGRGSLLYNCLQIKTLLTLGAASKDFESSSDHGRAWLIGQTNHWITVFSAKIPNAKRTHETILVDSRNNFVLTKSMDQIEQVAKHRLRNFHDQGMWAEMRRQFYLESLIDMPFSADLLHDCCTGRRDAVQHIIEMHFDTFFNSYSRHTSHYFDEDHGEEILVAAAGIDKEALAHTRIEHNLLPEDTSAGWLPTLLHWLADYYPAPVIEANICGMLEKLYHQKITIPSRIIQRLKKWKSTVMQRLRSVNAANDSTLERLAETWIRIESTLELICAL